MRELLKNGQILFHKELGSIRIEEFLGSGGQGEVYRVCVGEKQMALKWYFPNQSTDHQKKLIDRLCQLGAPNSNFLWPKYRVDELGKKGFGYIMPLRPERYKSIIDLMKRRVDPSFQSLTRAALLIVDGYKKLHDRGFCYRDISFGNVFFDPDNGDVFICDNDNIAYEKESDSSVLGTPRFMAPEIVTGKSAPTVSSDLYSLSVLLFYLFFVHHPLEGRRESDIKCFDLPAMTKLYGTDPLFIYDPSNHSNRPVRRIHENAIIYWNLYPDFFKNLFLHAFTGGLRNPNARIPESEWLRGLEKLLMSIQHCTCGAENFYDIRKVRTDTGSVSCWSCGTMLERPLRMRLRDEVVVLSRSTPLYAHMFHGSPRDFWKLHGRVTGCPKDIGKLGIHNLSTETWMVKNPNGSTLSLPSGTVLPLEHGQTIRFGNVEAEIRQY